MPSPPLDMTQSFSLELKFLRNKDRNYVLCVLGALKRCWNCVANQEETPASPCSVLMICCLVVWRSQFRLEHPCGKGSKSRRSTGSLLLQCPADQHRKDPFLGPLCSIPRAGSSTLPWCTSHYKHNCALTYEDRLLYGQLQLCWETWDKVACYGANAKNQIYPLSFLLLWTTWISSFFHTSKFCSE